MHLNHKGDTQKCDVPSKTEWQQRVSGHYGLCATGGDLAISLQSIRELKLIWGYIYAAFLLHWPMTHVHCYSVYYIYLHVVHEPE